MSTPRGSSPEEVTRPALSAGWVAAGAAVWAVVAGSWLVGGAT